MYNKTSNTKGNHMNNSNTLTIKFDTNPSPWQSTLVEVSFNKNKVQPIIDEILQSCTGKSYKASYMYDNDIELILKKYHDKSMGSIRPLLKAMQIMISEQQPENTASIWNNEYTAAIRSLNTMIAYSTPGFIEAKSYNTIYGS